MICASCGGEIPNDPRADNRYRGCVPCGWRMHHGCWIEHLSMGELHNGERCPIEFVERVRVEMVEVGGTTPTGKPKRKRKAVTHRDPELLDGHMTVIGMRGEWESV